MSSELGWHWKSESGQCRVRSKGKKSDGALWFSRKDWNVIGKEAKGVKKKEPPVMARTLAVACIQGGDE